MSDTDPQTPSPKEQPDTNTESGVTSDNPLTSGDPAQQQASHMPSEDSQETQINSPAGENQPLPQPEASQPKFVKHTHQGSAFVPHQPGSQLPHSELPGSQPGPAFVQHTGKKPANWQAITALSCGLVSIGFVIVSVGLLSPFMLFFGIAAIIFGVLGKRRVDRGEFVGQRGLAVAGIITGIVGIVFSFLAIAAWVALIVSGELDKANDPNSGEVLVSFLQHMLGHV